MNLTNKKVLATIILEMLGRPPEHLKESLQELINKMKNEKDIKIKSYKINEPKELEDNKSFFTTFAEIDLEAEEAKHILYLTFKYMPSHVEIVSPENLSLDNNTLNEILNELTRRLHAYDDVARIIQNEKIILENKLKELTKKKDSSK